MISEAETGCLLSCWLAKRKISPSVLSSFQYTGAKKEGRVPGQVWQTLVLKCSARAFGQFED